MPEFLVTTISSLFEALIAEDPRFEDYKFRIVFPGGPLGSSSPSSAEWYFDLTEFNFREFEISGFGTAEYIVSKEFAGQDIVNFIGNNNPLICLNHVCILAVPPSLTTPETTALMNAMHGQFAGSSYILKPLLEYASKMANLSVTSSAAFLAKLFHIFQSSGTGKTKVCLEMIKAVGHGSYFVNRTAAGFPFPSYWALDLVRRLDGTREDKQAIHLWLGYICASVLTFKGFTNDAAENVFFGNSLDLYAAFEDAFKSASTLPVSDIIERIEAALAGIDFFRLSLMKFKSSYATREITKTALSSSS